MTFEPKNEDTLRQEVIEDLKGDNDDFNETDHESQIDKITQRRLKDEEFKTSLHKQKTTKAKEADNMRKAKEFYKKGGKSKGAKVEDKGTQEESLISAEDKAYLFGANMKMSRTQVRHLEKVMKTTQKPWGKALEDGLYTSWNKDNDALITRKGSHLGASRGGGSKVETSKGLGGLPSEFNGEKKT